MTKEDVIKSLEELRSLCNSAEYCSESHDAESLSWNLIESAAKYREALDAAIERQKLLTVKCYNCDNPATIGSVRDELPYCDKCYAVLKSKGGW